MRTCIINYYCCVIYPTSPNGMSIFQYSINNPDFKTKPFYDKTDASITCARTQVLASKKRKPETKHLMSSFST